jgi:hypothetical protein
MNFRQTICLLTLGSACTAPVAAQSIATLEISNPADFDRPDAALYSSFDELGLSENVAVHPQLVVLNEGALLPSQLVDRDADGKNDGILYTLDLPAKATMNLEIAVDAEKANTEFTKRTQAEISVKKGGEWVDHQRGRGFKQYRGGTFTNVDSVTLCLNITPITPTGFAMRGRASNPTRSLTASIWIGVTVLISLANG